MGTPSEYLPPALSSDLISEFIESLDLPRPTTVQQLEVAAQFHTIYIIHYAGAGAAVVSAKHHGLHAGTDGTLDLVLRIAGRHLPRIKTFNEVGIMTWVKKHTSIPIPYIVSFDASDNNLLAHEFTLLEKAKGVSADKIYESLTDAAKENLVDQLIDYLAQLHSLQFEDSYVGGLIIGSDGKITNGPVIDEYFWQVSDIQKYWPSTETIESLNPISAGGFPNYTAFISASIERYMHAINIHDSMRSFRDLLPRLAAFVTAIESAKNVASLNKVRYILAHKDLHFANIMCDASDPLGCVTAVLDWEFSGVVPAPRWNPPRAFLWNAQKNDGAKSEQDALEKLYEFKCREKGLNSLLEDANLEGLQEPMQTLTNYLRAIVEVCPRGQAQDRVGTWRAMVEACLEAFGV